LTLDLKKKSNGSTPTITQPTATHQFLPKLRILLNSLCNTELCVWYHIKAYLLVILIVFIDYGANRVFFV